MKINGYELVWTSDACPKRYDTFKDNKQVDCLRLWFGADHPKHGSVMIYRACLKGNGE